MLIVYALILTGDVVNYKGTLFMVQKTLSCHLNRMRSKIPIFIAAVNAKMIIIYLSLAEVILLYLRPEHELRRIVSQFKV